MTTDDFQGIFTTEEEALREGERLLASDSFSSPGDRERYGALLANYRSLLAQMKRMVRISDRMEGELNRATGRMEALSNIDALTGLFNRRHFETAMERDWKRASRTRSPVTIVMMDIDHFKSYNDEFGHPEGDSCLRMVGSVIEDAMKRSGDWAARYGGEEFVLCFPDTGIEGSTHVVERILERISSSGAEGGIGALKRRVTLSAGIASRVADHHVAWTDLVKAADKALYRAKSEGRNRIRFAETERT